jgi:hypothetical protein
MTPAILALRLYPAPPPEQAAPSSKPGPSHRDATLAAIDEMMERLETVTDAGRQHLMSKIVSVLVSHPLAAGAPILAARVEVLRKEARRASPDGGAFTSVARPLVALLAAAKLTPGA